MSRMRSDKAFETVGEDKVKSPLIQAHDIAYEYAPGTADSQKVALILSTFSERIMELERQIEYLMDKDRENLK